jgi:hypothetical protein
VDFADDAGLTALHRAVSSGFEDCVQELIEEGADVNVLASCGVALNVAADKRRDRVAEILLRARPNCDEAIVFEMESGLNVGVLREFLTQAVRSSGVESPWQRIAVLATITTARQLVHVYEVAMRMWTSLAATRVAHHQSLPPMEELTMGMWSSTPTTQAAQGLVLTTTASKQELEYSSRHQLHKLLVIYQSRPYRGGQSSGGQHGPQSARQAVLKMYWGEKA